VEQQSDLSGGNWVVSATYLKGVGLVRRNSEFHHFDVLGTAGVITDASGAVLSANVYDAFGVARYVSGNAQTQWRASAGYTEVEGLLANCYIVAELALGLAQKCKKDQDPVLGMCIVLCESLIGMPCGQLPPGLEVLCKLAKKIGCQKACEDVRRWKPWKDCAGACKYVPEPRCVDCCNTLCEGKGALAACYKMCATRDPDLTRGGVAWA